MKYMTQTSLGHYGREELRRMTPKKFLDLSQAMTIKDDFLDEKSYSRSNLAEMRKDLVLELEQKPLEMTVDSKTGEVITSHGRNIAFAAHQLGIKKIPVFVKYINITKRTKKTLTYSTVDAIPELILRKPTKKTGFSRTKKHKKERWVYSLPTYKGDEK